MEKNGFDNGVGEVEDGAEGEIAEKEGAGGLDEGVVGPLHGGGGGWWRRRWSRRRWWWWWCEEEEVCDWVCFLEGAGEVLFDVGVGGGGLCEDCGEV